MRISQAQLDAQAGLAAVYTVSKAINDGTWLLETSNTGTAVSTNIVPWATSLTIMDTLVVTQGPILASRTPLHSRPSRNRRPWPYLGPDFWLWDLGADSASSSERTLDSGFSHWSAG